MGSAFFDSTLGLFTQRLALFGTFFRASQNTLTEVNLPFINLN